MRQTRAEQIELETARLRLRRPEQRDLAEIVPLADNWNIASMLGNMPHPYALADARSWLAEVDRDWARDSITFTMRLVREQDQPLCGVIGLFSFAAGHPTLGFWLGEPYWRRGLMTEAVDAIVGLAFERILAPAVDAHHLLDNPASGRVLEKCGFEEIERCLVWSRAHFRYMPGRAVRLRAGIAEVAGGVS